MISDGILVLNKPRDWTSHDCVAVCRRALRLKGVKKIGHGGTLDPMAEGLLPIFIGQATRIMEYMDLEDKTYVCRARLGVTTDTQDIWGTVLSQTPVRILSGSAADGSSTDGGRVFPPDGGLMMDLREEDVRAALDSFRGVIEQIPPAFSAVRVDGKHLYEYAHKGREVDREIPSRKVFIPRLEVLDVDTDRGSVAFALQCSRGTYVRTICHDLGRKLGCGAAMESLQRTAVGTLDLTRSIGPEEVKRAGEEELEALLLPVDRPLMRLGEAVLSPERAGWFSRGNSTRRGNVHIKAMPSVEEDPLTGSIPLNARGRRYDRLYRVYEEGTGTFLGIGFDDEEEGLLKADKVFVPKRLK